MLVTCKDQLQTPMASGSMAGTGGSPDGV